MTEKSRVLRIFGIALIVSQAAACSWLTGDDGYFRDRKNDYLQDKVLEPLQVPEEIESSKDEEELFLIPDVVNRDLPAQDFDVPRPAPLLNAATGDNVRIQKLGENLWLLIDVPPSHLWQRVKNFLNINRISVGLDQADTGILETVWLQRTTEDIPKTKERYRYRVDQGVQRNSAEVHITHVSIPFSQDIPETTDWPEKSQDPEREKWMVQNLAQYLANDSGFSSVSLLAQGIGRASKVSMVKNTAGNTVVQLQLPFDRAWASVGNALKKADFNINDLDRSKGRYYVSFQPELEAEQPGFFARLFGADAAESSEREDYIFNVLPLDKDQGVEVAIDAAEGKTLSGEKARALLERFKGFLS